MDAQQPGLSQDGRKLIFRKQRANKEELWIKSLETAAKPYWLPQMISAALTLFGHTMVSRLLYLRSRPAAQGQTGGRPADRSVSGVTASGWQRRAGTNVSSARPAVAYRLDAGWKMDSGEHRLANTGPSSPLPIPH